MKTTEKSQLVKNNNNVKLILIIIGLLISVYLGLIIVSKINVNILWFKEVNYLEIFWKTSFTKLFLWLITFLIFIYFLFVNFIIDN